MRAESHKDVPRHETHDAGDKLPNNITKEATHGLTDPSSKLNNSDVKERGGIPKDFGDHKSFDFNTAPHLYGDSPKSAEPAEGKGQSHSMTDGKNNTPPPVGDAKPVAPKADYDRSRELGDSQAKSPTKPDSGAAAGAVEPIPDPPKSGEATPSSKAKPDSDSGSYLGKLTDLWSHGVAQMMGEQ